MTFVSVQPVTEFDYAQAIQARIDRLIHWRPIIEKSLQRHHSLKNFNDLVQLVISGTWFMFDVGGAFALVQPDPQPKGLSLFIYFAGGDYAYFPELDELVHSFAKTIGAVRITALGRDGFRRTHLKGWRSTKMTMFEREV
jgi:hypothetical protein